MSPSPLLQPYSGKQEGRWLEHLGAYMLVTTQIRQTVLSDVLNDHCLDVILVVLLLLPLILLLLFVAYYCAQARLKTGVWRPVLVFLLPFVHD